MKLQENRITPQIQPETLEIEKVVVTKELIVSFLVNLCFVIINVKRIGRAVSLFLYFKTR